MFIDIDFKIQAVYYYVIFCYLFKLENEYELKINNMEGLQNNKDKDKEEECIYILYYIININQNYVI